MNHHTGTLEEAARQTQEALARTQGAVPVGVAVPPAQPQSEQGSMQGSPMPTDSPSQRPVSMSPGAAADLAGINNMAYTINNSNLPPHLRNEHSGGSPTPTQSTAYTPNPRPTSHPTNYATLQTLEPSVENQQGPGSAVGSPHMASVGWQSPSHAQSPTPSNTGNSSYTYPDPEAGFASNHIGQMFYASAATGQLPNTKESPSATNSPHNPPKPLNQAALWATTGQQ